MAHDLGLGDWADGRRCRNTRPLTALQRPMGGAKASAKRLVTAAPSRDVTSVADDRVGSCV